MALIAIVLAFPWSYASLVCYAIIPMVYIFPSHVDLYWTRPHVKCEHGVKKRVAEVEA